MSNIDEKQFFGIICLENDIRECFRYINEGKYLEGEEPNAFEESRALFHLKATLEDSIAIVDKRMEMIGEDL